MTSNKPFERTPESKGVILSVPGGATQGRR